MQLELKYGKFIAITLMDHDDLSVDDAIGSVVLNLKTLLEGVKGERETGAGVGAKVGAGGGKKEDEGSDKRR